MELVYLPLHAMIDFCMVLHSWDGTDIAISNETPSQQVVFVQAAHFEKEHIQCIYIYLHTYIIYYIYTRNHSDVYVYICI